MPGGTHGWPWAGRRRDRSRLRGCTTAVRGLEGTQTRFLLCFFLHLIATFVLFFAFLHSLCFALHFYLCLYYFSFVYFLCYYICCTLYVLFFLCQIPWGPNVNALRFWGGAGGPNPPGLRWLVGSDPPPRCLEGVSSPPWQASKGTKIFFWCKLQKIVLFLTLKHVAHFWVLFLNRKKWVFMYFSWFWKETQVLSGKFGLVSDPLTTVFCNVYFSSELCRVERRTCPIHADRKMNPESPFATFGNARK